MESVESEQVPFIEAINPAATGAVEKWLLDTERIMKRTLHSLAGDALRSYAQSERSQWILEWPGQLVLNCSQVYWTQVRIPGLAGSELFPRLNCFELLPGLPDQLPCPGARHCSDTVSGTCCPAASSL